MYQYPTYKNIMVNKMCFKNLFIISRGVLYKSSVCELENSRSRNVLNLLTRNYSSKSIISISHLKRNEAKLNFFSSNSSSDSIDSISMNDSNNLQTRKMFDLGRKIFLASVGSVIPSFLIRSQVSLKNGNFLNIQNDFSIDLNSFNNCYVIGFGKAVLPMAEELLKIIGDRVTRCVLNVPVGSQKPLNPKLEIFEGAKNNIPDEASFYGTKKIVEIVSSCGEQDLLIILISGGGSALLTYPKPPISIQEKGWLIRQLSRAGAEITELNAIRRQLSLVKGGGLANFSKAGQTISLILSDVLGDKLDMIASGPTVHFKCDENINPLSIIRKFIPIDQIPQNILHVLENDNKIDCEKKSQNTLHQRKVDNILLGTNKIALNSASKYAESMGYKSFIMSSTLEGDARTIGEKIAQLSILMAEYINLSHGYQIKSLLESILIDLQISPEIYQKMFKIFEDQKRNISEMNESSKSQGICLLFGGETTVIVKGTGLGGRNQELALSSALYLHNLRKSSPTAEKIAILSAGTDGIDGPCDAAGAIIDSWTVLRAYEQQLDPLAYLDNNDSYNFFKTLSNGAYHVKTGHTGTNVMDITLVIIN